MIILKLPYSWRTKARFSLRVSIGFPGTGFILNLCGENPGTPAGTLTVLPASAAEDGTALGVRAANALKKPMLTVTCDGGDGGDGGVCSISQADFFLRSHMNLHEFILDLFGS